MAAAFLGVANAATAAPLNPGYRVDEFEFYLRRPRRPKAVVVQNGVDSPVREAAQRSSACSAGRAASRTGGWLPPGTFDLSGVDQRSAAERPGAAGSDDVGLVLHTSGTTSRPKIVPLRQRNLTASARQHPRDAVNLTSEPTAASTSCRCSTFTDVIAGVLASPSARADAPGCSPGFNAMQVFGWMREAEALLVHRRTNDAPTDPDPRLAQRRDSGRDRSALHPLLLLIAAADCDGRAWKTPSAPPVIESYGMTEAAHQMSSNPLPPLERKPGQRRTRLPAPRSRSWTRTARYWRWASAARS